MTRIMVAAGLFLAALADAGCAASRLAARQEAAPMCRCTPDQPCWPSQAEWQRFGASLHGKLERPQSPLAVCRKDARGEPCAAAMRNSQNPFYLQEQPGGTQSAGWLGAWNAPASAYAAAAGDAADIVAWVNFARRNRLRMGSNDTGPALCPRCSGPAHSQRCKPQISVFCV